MQDYKPGVKVSQLLSTSAAREYGVRVGDVITAVNGEVLPADGKSVNVVVDRVRASGASVVRFDVLRRAEVRSIHWSPYDGVRVVNAVP